MGFHTLQGDEGKGTLGVRVGVTRCLGNLIPLIPCIKGVLILPLPSLNHQSLDAVYLNYSIVTIIGPLGRFPAPPVQRVYHDIPDTVWLLYIIIKLQNACYSCH